MKAERKPYVIIKHKGMSRKERRILRRLANKEWREVTSDKSHAHKKEFHRLNIRRQYRVTRARIISVDKYIDATHESKRRLQLFDVYMKKNQFNGFGVNYGKPVIWDYI
jgi:hypothetical protein